MTVPADMLNLFDRHVIANYTRFPVTVERAAGSWFWDAAGKKYLDLFSGWAVASIGHSHPRLVKAIQDQAAKLIYMPNIFYHENQGRLAERIAAHSFDGKVFFCNSGAESVEGAIKLARLSTPPERFKVLSFENSFHGRTLATLTATGQLKYREGVGPVPEGFVHAPYNDLAAAEKLADGETAAILVEVIQGEGGVNIGSREFICGLRDLCDEKGIRLVFDEVWTGVGRTARWFAHQHYGVTPDIMTLAKGLGGGVVLAAVVARGEIAEAMKPGTHASTFGGSPLATAAGCTVFDVIEEEGLLENARVRGEELLAGLRAASRRTGLVRDVRGLGLMAAAELACPGALVVKAALERGLLVNCAHETVIRFAPCLNVTAEELREGLDLFEAALAAAGAAVPAGKSA